MAKSYYSFIRKFILCLSVLMVLLFEREAFAMSLKTEVTVVKNEKQMIRKLAEGMAKHQEYFAFTYKGIRKDYARYAKSDNQYQTLWNEVAKRNGYSVGIVSGSCITFIDGSKPQMVIQLGYLTTRKQQKIINKKIKRFVVKRKDYSQYEKIKATHDDLIQRITYSDGVINPYDGLVNGKGMCMTYALLFQRYMQEFGIPCRYVRGQNHAWNRVKLNGTWYNVDVTWDDAGANPYRYFLKLDDDFPNH